MKLFKNKKGMSLFYVIIMMAVVTALSSAMIAAAVYNNTLARLTESKFERRIELDQIGEDFRWYPSPCFPPRKGAASCG